MSRSTLRPALLTGALCVTATSTAIIAPDAAGAAGISLGAKRLDIQSGSRLSVNGRAAAPATASLQLQRARGWATLDRSRSDAGGRFVLRRRVGGPLSARARVRLSTGATRSLGRVNVYRRALASWYGPGLIGNRLGCGGTLRADQLGVAHKTLPCGTKVTLRHRGRVLRVRVIDRGPYVGGREYDLTSATASRLRFRGHGPIQVTR